LSAYLSGAGPPLMFRLLTIRSVSDTNDRIIAHEGGNIFGPEGAQLMASKTTKAAGHRSDAAKTAKSSGKVVKAQSNHKPGTDGGSSRTPAPVIGRSRMVASKPLRKQEMPVDEKHVAAVHNFELGLQQEQRQNYRKAREIFEKLAATAPADVADRSRVHLKACTERLGSAGPMPKTSADYHVLGVAELNVGNLDRAVEHLNKAQKLSPEREEIRYALAAAYSLKGDRDTALEHLKASILLRPQNRFQARHDPDFQAIAADDRFHALLGQNGHRPPGASN
jgi:predicted Zn-dependent protease